ncbi:MAG: methyltransferase domain-containing protein [Terracidiphilus sp.]
MSQNEKIYQTPEDAFRFVVEHFPFKNYINAGSNNHLNIARCVRRHLAPGAKILDFGAGPCDKTAVLQAMGFECSAYDDLQDAWHVKSNNRERIVAFAESAGIHFTLAKPGVGLGYPKAYFDMLILNDVLEHLHDSPRELMNSLLELVKPNGLLLMTVPNAGNIRKRLVLLFGGTNYQQFDTYYWYPGQWRGHVREYVKSDLRKLSKYLSLEVLELHGCDQMLHRVRGVSRGVYVAATSLMKGWKDSWILVARKGTDWRPQRDIPPGEKISRPTIYLYGE